MVKCFKCECEMSAAICPPVFREEDAWEMPNGGVQFEGGWNYGSRLYDAMNGDGIHVELIVCDDCLAKGKEDGRLREMRRITQACYDIHAEDVIDQ